MELNDVQMDAGLAVCPILTLGDNDQLIMLLPVSVRVCCDAVGAFVGPPAVRLEAS